jgi:hypothetical protein
VTTAGIWYACRRKLNQRVMNRTRRHLRAWASTWLVIQVLSLSALLPRDCCAAHRLHKGPAAHGAADEAACAMHPAQKPEPECSLRGTCNGPVLALPITTTSADPASTPFTLAPDTVFTEAAVALVARPTAIDVLSDTPPPRA